MTTNRGSTLIALHGAVLLFALSGLFGEWINLPASFIVLGRTLFAGLFLLSVLSLFKPQSLKIKRIHLRYFIWTSVLLAVHWTSFFAAIQLSSVAFGLLAFATFPLFTSVIEPLLMKEPRQPNSGLFALVTVIGIYLIYPADISLHQGILALLSGLISALSFVFLLVGNRRLATHYPPYTIACGQNLCASVFLLPMLLIQPIEISQQDFALLLLLGIVFTAIAHSLLNYALKVVKAFDASIAISLEPVYGIVAAWILLSEALSGQAMIGALLIIAMNVYITMGNSARSNSA